MEIEGYSNYLIYEDGRVFSKKRLGTNGGFMKANPNSEGYLQVQLNNYGHKTFRIHRLIATYYIPNPNNYEEVDHKDRNRQNNSIDNLRWVNRSMNQQNKGLFKTNKLGISNIYQADYGYRFKIVRNGKKHQKRFKTLEEAIKYKEEYLN
tara:strand:+ start:55 stop:504 length:450 start_codon:yes stop_codon:yes gene_type:complete